MVLEFDLFVPQRNSGTRGGGLVFLRLPLGVVAGLAEALADPGPEGELEVQPGGDRRRRPVRAGPDVGIGGPHHLHDQAGVQRMGGVDVLGEAVGVDERRVRRHVAAHVVGRGDHREQLDIGPQPLGPRLADGDGALRRLLGRRAFRGMRAGHGQVDRGGGGQALRRRHERLGLVGVVGAFGLAQQGGDARQHLVVCHARSRLALPLDKSWPTTSIDFPVRVPGHRCGHGSSLLGDELVQRGDQLRRQRVLLGVVRDVVGGIVTQDVVDTLERRPPSTRCGRAHPISGLIATHSAWPSESEQVSSTGVPCAMCCASATGSMASCLDDGLHVGRR